MMVSLDVSRVKPSRVGSGAGALGEGGTASGAESGTAAGYGDIGMIGKGREKVFLKWFAIWLRKFIPMDIERNSTGDCSPNTNPPLAPADEVSSLRFNLGFLEASVPWENANSPW